MSVGQVGPFSRVARLGLLGTAFALCISVSHADIAFASAGQPRSTPASVSPRRVMSINLCADQLVLALLPVDAITSVSWIARDASQSYLAAAAARVPVNFGTAEEVARQRPDVLIAGTYTTPATLALLHRVGRGVVELPPMNSFEAIRTGTRLVADAVGARVRAEVLLAHMDERLDWLARHPLQRHWRVLAWDGSGAVPGRGTLNDAVLTSAGAVDVAAEDAPAGVAAADYAQFDLETLLRRAPEVIAQSDPAFARPGRSDDVAHPAVIARVWAGRRIYMPRAGVVCGTPFAADVAASLHDELVALP